MSKQEVIICHNLEAVSYTHLINPKAEFNRSEISKIEEIPFDMQTLLL